MKEKGNSEKCMILKEKKNFILYYRRCLYAYIA